MGMRFNPMLPLLVAVAAAEKAACPCMNVSSLFAAQRGAAISSRPNCTLYTQSKGVAVDPICLPSDYGSSGCAAYDANVD